MPFSLLRWVYTLQQFCISMSVYKKSTSWEYNNRIWNEFLSTLRLKIYNLVSLILINLKISS
jgi:hypothetical protein